MKEKEEEINWNQLEFEQISYFKSQSLDLTLSEYPAGNPEYVQTTPAGHILFGF